MIGEPACPTPLQHLRLLQEGLAPLTSTLGSPLPGASLAIWGSGVPPRSRKPQPTAAGQPAVPPAFAPRPSKPWGRAASGPPTPPELPCHVRVGQVWPLAANFTARLAPRPHPSPWPRPPTACLAPPLTPCLGRGWASLPRLPGRGLVEPRPAALSTAGHGREARQGAGGGAALGRGPRAAAAGGRRAANNPPYNAGAFRFELTFSPRHPLAPPRATLRTSIYHPAVDAHGRVCQPLTSAQHWVPTTRATQVLQDLLLLLDSPDPQRVLRPELARELREQPQLFRRRAEEHTRLHAESRPPDPPGP
ncbi:uncharacterized protein [Ciconia boyciana]|uniref:uncharacterized protein isoform X1 n=1 Tax=Ciconia boyciana TaxID=52775 RepID=UPI003BA3BA47